MAKNVKKRNWAFVLYPESAPENWREELQKTGLQCAISPLHDRDMNPDNTPKKAHYHVILTYSGPTSYNVVKALTDGFNQPIPQALEQVRVPPLSVPLPIHPSTTLLPPQIHIGHVILSMIFFTFCILFRILFYQSIVSLSIVLQMNT